MRRLSVHAVLVKSYLLFKGVFNTFPSKDHPTELLGRIGMKIKNLEAIVAWSGILIYRGRRGQRLTVFPVL